MIRRAAGALLFACIAIASLRLAADAPPASGETQRLGEAIYQAAPEPAPPAFDTAGLAGAPLGARATTVPLSTPPAAPATASIAPTATTRPPALAALPVTLPDLRRAAPGTLAPPGGYRMRFGLLRAPSSMWGVLLPYLSGGGQVWVNGERIDDILAGDADLQVRWERPHLVAIPERLLRAGANELWVRAMPVAGAVWVSFPAPRVGPLNDLRTVFDRRMFWVHTVPQFTVAACLVVAAFLLLTWWRLPEQTLYGWFGLATALWGIRTLTFVMETMPQDRWLPWRTIYLATTGGFVVVMAIFSCELAGLRRRWVERALLVYWAIGPIWLLARGIGADDQVNRVWTAGLVPVGLGVIAAAVVAVWRQRTLTALILPAALAIATLAGMHDYLLVWQRHWLAAWAPEWAEQRYFLLHHGANLLLLAMGLLLSIRVVRNARSLRELNRTLESRIAERERSLADNYVRLAQLERQNAASEERQLIMREIHDGLGSKLFTSLSRVERGAMDAPQMAASLRACIADMRLALDALAPGDQELLAAFGDFMFRWQAELEAAGVRCRWDIDVADDDLRLPPHATLQVLRIAQEALTNVVKHARATRVDLSLRHAEGRLALRIEDDGIGAGNASSWSGRGVNNMRTRAGQLGGTLALGGDGDRGTRVVLTVPVGDRAARLDAAREAGHPAKA